jgi:alanyl-tRNA synthetase
VEYGRIRLVDIADFDLTACGGTHVSRTGGVGLIKIVKIERRNEQARVEFRCGGRALQDYQQKNDVINTLTTQLTTGIPDLVNGVTRLQEENKQAQRLIKKQQAELLQKTAENLLQNGRRVNQTLLICHVMTEGDASQLRLLANLLTAQNGVVVLLGLAGAKSQLLFCRSADAPGQMNQLLKPALKLLGGGGGGNALMSQGGGQAATSEQVQQALEKATSLFLQNI